MANKIVEVHQSNDLFDSIFRQEDLIIRIPFYQRNFEWNEEKIKGFLISIFEEKLKNKKFFIGSILIKIQNSNPYSGEGKKIYEIIDGQQRMTLILLLLLQINDFFSEIEFFLIKNHKNEIEFRTISNEIAGPRGILINHLKSYFKKVKKDENSNFKYYADNDFQNVFFDFIHEHLFKEGYVKNFNKTNLLKNKKNPIFVKNNYCLKFFDGMKWIANILNENLSGFDSFEELKNRKDELLSLWSYISRDIQTVFLEIIDNDDKFDVFVKLNTNTQLLTEWDIFKAFLSKKIRELNFEANETIKVFLSTNDSFFSQNKKEKYSKPLLRTYIINKNNYISATKNKISEIKKIFEDRNISPNITFFKELSNFLTFFLQNYIEDNEFEISNLNNFSFLMNNFNLQQLKQYYIAHSFGMSEIILKKINSFFEKLTYSFLINVVIFRDSRANDVENMLRKSNFFGIKEKINWDILNSNLKESPFFKNALLNIKKMEENIFPRKERLKEKKWTNLFENFLKIKEHSLKTDEDLIKILNLKIKKYIN